MKRVTLPVLLIILLFPSCGRIISKTNRKSYNFSTHGQTVYHLQTGYVTKGKKAIITTSINGAVKCFSPEGKLLWTSDTTNNGFPFDLCVANIDNDGFDEVLVAYGNGTLCAYSHNGNSLWTFSRLPPLYQVSVARKADGTAIIFTGGPEKILYALSPQGKVINTMHTEHCIRHIRAGNVMNNGKDYVAVATTSKGLNGFLSLMLIDPTDFSVVWTKENLGTWAANTGKRFFSMLVHDLNHDGYDEILLSGGWGENGRLYAYDHNGDSLFTKSDKKIPNIPYRMNLLRYIKLPDDEFFIGHFGNVLIVYEPDGTLREIINGTYSFADSYFDQDLKTLFMGSSVSGGDGIYALQLNQPGWQEKFKSIHPVGKLAEIEKNVKILNKQITEFKSPVYQPAPCNSIVIAQEPRERNFQNLTFVKSITLSQKIENREELWCKETDRRRQYNSTAEDLVKIVEKYESEGQNFIIWAGHGSAVYFPLSTFERIIKAAPEHLTGFIFAEMESIDKHTQEVAANIILPLAELCKEYGMVIVLRNKNIFWNGSCYLPLWRKVLLNKRYSSVFIPALEETNCRTQELSLAGRIGLWQTGNFNHWACRMVTDNANFDRMFEWGGQQVITHHLRNLVSTASLGADIFINNIYAGDNTSKLFKQLIPFYEMLDKGIIHIPKKTELLSLSDFALGIKNPPSGVYIKHGTNGHNYWFPSVGKSEMVFGHLDTYWGGTDLDPYDYSYYAMDIRRRMTNFLPVTPYGMTAIIPAETKANDRFKNITVTDGQYFYDKRGNRFSAKEYKPIVEASLTEAAERMPVIVKGDVHWSVTRLDPEHLRVTLIDPGFLDPTERQAEIFLQHLEGIHCTDILSGESLKIKGERISVTVPAGVFRILDITHRGLKKTEMVTGKKIEGN